MPEFFSSDGSLPLQFLVIFGVIVVVMVSAYLLFRRLFGRGITLSQGSGSRARQPRLGIVDIYELDRQRQLILLRRDNVEHLLLVGGPNDVVIERNVQRGAGSRLPAETLMRPEPASDMPALPVQEPDFGPSFEMPVVVPTPLPGTPEPSEPQPSRLDPAFFAPDLEPQDVAPAPRPEPALPRARANPFLRRTPPPLVEPRREPASERPTGPSAHPGEPPILVAPEPRPVDPAELSGMARQLETALKRSPSAMTPPPRPPAPVAPPPPADEPEPPAYEPEPEPEAVPQPEADPIAARMAASPTPAFLSAAPDPVPPAPEPPMREPAAPPPPPVAVPPAAPPIAAAPAAPPERRPEPGKGANPFSVEEIEAEFARLLGRPLDKKG